MSNKDYENRNQDYGNYHNKSYYSSKGDESKSHIPSSIIFFIIVSILSGVIALDKLEIENPVSLNSAHTKSEVKHQQLPVEKTDIRPERQIPNSIDKKRILDYIDKSNDVLPYNNRREFEKALETANYESLNKTESYIREKQQETRRLLEQIRLSMVADKTKDKHNKLKEFKELKQDYNKFVKATNEIIRLIEQKRSELDKNTNTKNINKFYEMDEHLLLKEMNDYLSGKYTYRRNGKNSKPEDVQKELISVSINKNYSKFLDILITQLSKKNLLIIDEDYYNQAYISAWSNRPECFEVFVKHGIDLKNVHERNNRDSTIIHLAASKGEVEILKHALEAGIPIDQRTNFNLTPLYLAIKENKYEAVEFLIEQGALAEGKLDEYNNYGNILFFPIRNKNYKMLELLVNNGVLLNEDLRIYTNDRKILRFIRSKGQQNSEPQADIRDREWEKAYNYIIGGNLERLKELENSGKDLSNMYYDGEPAICIAVENNQLQIVEYLVKKYDCQKLVDRINGRNALHYAAMSDNSYKMLDVLLQNGFDPNELDKDNNTPLNLAVCCNYNKPQYTRLLLDNGANPNLLNKNNQHSLFFLTDVCYSPLFELLLKKGAVINLYDSEGNTPLHYFLLKSPIRKKFIASFLSHKANIHAVNLKGQTPLHFAILTNDKNATWQLLRGGANINKQDIEGNTPLHYVAQYAQNKIMVNEIYRLSFGNADLNIKNNEGKTPYNIVEPNCFYQSDFKHMIPAKE